MTGSRIRRPLGLAVSVAAHLGVLAVVMTMGPPPQRLAEPEILPVQIVAPRLVPPPEPPPKPAPPSPAPPKAAPVTPPPKLKVRRPVRPPPPDVAPLRAATGPTTAPGDELSDAEIASAAGAGSGSGSGSGCDMAGWLQGKLRKDRGVQAAMAAAHAGRPLLVWNGDWVPHPGQEGAGLATVREAIMWEVAFAPIACRKEPVRGLIVLALADAPGSPRVVMGARNWRWSDLLFSRSTKGRPAGPQG